MNITVILSIASIIIGFILTDLTNMYGTSFALFVIGAIFLFRELD